MGVSASLTTESEYVTVLNSSINYGDIPIGEAMIIEPFIIDFSSDTPSSSIEFNLEVVSNENDYVQYKKNILITYQIEEASNFLLGDLNADEEFSILDIVLLLNIVLGSSEATSYQLEVGDLNQDGILNILDIVSLLNLILSGG